MDPWTYCKEALDELLGRGSDLASDGDELQRGAVLAYLARLRLSEHEFVRELKQLPMRAVREGRPGIADAALSILLAWQGRTARSA